MELRKDFCSIIAKKSSDSLNIFCIIGLNVL